MRGQTDSPFSPDDELGEKQIVADAVKLLAAVSPVRPILVGLSIGGLFASRVWLAGSEAMGLVLINTLRREGARLKWIGDALVRAVEVGGLPLFRDLFLPSRCRSPDSRRTTRSTGRGLTFICKGDFINGHLA